MHLRRRLTDSFQSRVALRVFLICVLCSLLPTVIIGVTVYTHIARAEREVKQSRLEDAAKRYGILLQDRLSTAEQTMVDVAARLVASSSHPNQRVDTAIAAAISVLPIDRPYPLPEANPNHAGNAPTIYNESLVVVRRDGKPAVQLALNVLLASGKAERISGVVRPEHLWNADALDAAGIRLCVTVAHVELACRGEPLASGDVLSASWELYLRPHYGAQSWRITATQPKGVSEAALVSLRSALPYTAAIAFIVALLVGLFEVRRIHGPLGELLAAFKGMTRGRFSKVGLHRRRDEYGRIGRAFNQLSRTMRRQFRMLATFERMDRAILERPSVQDLVAALLPRVPQMLDCECAALWLTNADGQSVLHATASSRTVQSIVTGSFVVNDINEQLHKLNPHMHWEQVPLRLEGVQRGRLYCGRLNAQRGTPTIRRHAKSIARRFVVALRNEERENLLFNRAYYDELTQLPNRRLLNDRVQQVLGEAEANKESVAFLYLDLDRFKTLNDSLGHRAGDELLKLVAKRLSGAVGPRDTVARLGGDEFAILMPHAKKSEILAASERVLTAFRGAATISGVIIMPQSSVGVAMYPDDGADFETLLRNADVAMYRGKANGGGRVVFFEDNMNAQAVRRLHVESRLRNAFQSNYLRMVYQPKISLQNGSLQGVEALMRWSDPELGEVSPEEFIAVAEDSGLIHELGRVALRQSIRFARQCLESSIPIGHVAVNVSMLQLRDTGFCDFLQNELRVHRLPPGMLQIEMTETALMQDVDTAGAILQQVRNMGIRIAIDDFGTGYSSLAVLQVLPVDSLKIDRSFIVSIDTNLQSLELVRAMLAVSRALGLEVLAEGVERYEQAQLLADNACELAQGYYFSEPLPEMQMLELAARWNMSDVAPKLQSFAS
jgi:diguanylate cyclase (GGDEF)-like protein